MIDVVDDVLYLKNKQPMDKEYAVIIYFNHLILSN